MLLVFICKIAPASIPRGPSPNATLKEAFNANTGPSLVFKIANWALRSTLRNFKSKDIASSASKPSELILMSI